MKEIELTQGKVALVDDDDFELLNQWKWYYHHGYAVRKCKEKMIFMHRIILKTPVGFDTDHINCKKLDNRRSNLRMCTKSQNQANKGIGASNKSGYKGVMWYKQTKRWHSQITHKGKKYHLGFFKNISDAIEAYKKKSKELFGDFSYKDARDNP